MIGWKWTPERPMDLTKSTTSGSSHIFSLTTVVLRESLMPPLSRKFSIAVMTSSKLPFVPLVSLAMCRFKLFNDRHIESKPESTILLANVLSINDPFEVRLVTIPFLDANLMISSKSFLKSASPPVIERLNVPSHALSFASTPFHSSRLSSYSSGLDVQRKHVGHARLQI